MVVANQGGKSINVSSFILFLPPSLPPFPFLFVCGVGLCFDVLHVFTVDTTTGLLTLRKTVSGFDQPAFVGIYATPPTPAPAPTPPTSSPSPTRKPSSTRNVKPTL